MVANGFLICLKFYLHVWWTCPSTLTAKLSPHSPHAWVIGFTCLWCTPHRFSCMTIQTTLWIPTNLWNSPTYGTFIWSWILLFQSLWHSEDPMCAHFLHAIADVERTADGVGALLQHPLPSPSQCTLGNICKWLRCKTKSEKMAQVENGTYLSDLDNWATPLQRWENRCVSNKEHFWSWWRQTDRQREVKELQMLVGT